MCACGRLVEPRPSQIESSRATAGGSALVPTPSDRSTSVKSSSGSRAASGRSARDTVGAAPRQPWRRSEARRGSV
eukprot:scaffold229290_cov28-Tisochrysis_lutea.AAC.8